MQVGKRHDALTLRDVIDRHGGEIWYQRERRRIGHFPLRAAGGDAGSREQVVEERTHRPAGVLRFRPVPSSRTGRSTSTASCRSDLHGFDTETTGPGAVERRRDHPDRRARIVNNRLLRQETFDQLVDRKCRSSRSRYPSTAFTGTWCAPAEHRSGLAGLSRILCEDTVLIAHNAAFDMRFLQLKEERTGIRFTQPVLDTLLLSAVVIPTGVAQARRHSGTPRHHHRHPPQCAGGCAGDRRGLPQSWSSCSKMGHRYRAPALEASEKTYFARVKY